MKRLLGISGLSALLLVVFSGELWAQTLVPFKGICSVRAAAFNKNRKVHGPIRVECGGEWPHTAPWGNWGVTSPFGVLEDGHQFDGWCKDRWVCDNYGNCKCDCGADPVQVLRGERWYQWNGCTADPKFKPRNCTLYNADDCTAQESTQGINKHGEVIFGVSVNCPYDSTGDGFCDSGGCKDLTRVTWVHNWMSVYEIDNDALVPHPELTPGSDLVQTLYFPQVVPVSKCNISTCKFRKTIKWFSPSSYEDPSESVIEAKLGIQVLGVTYEDPGRKCDQAGVLYEEYNCK